MITNKERHRNISYQEDSTKISRAIASQSFVSLEEIFDDFYEISSEKKKICLDIPVVLGFSVLQYAKLRMLQFYYDCIDRYLLYYITFIKLYQYKSFKLNYIFIFFYLLQVY